MKLLRNICLPSATFPPSAHISGALPSSTKRIHKPFQGAVAIHCVQSLGQPLGATLLKMLAKVFRGAEGCSLFICLALRTKFSVNKQHL